MTDGTGAEALAIATGVTAETLSRHPWMVMWRDQVLSDACLGATTALLSHDPARGDLAPRLWRRTRGAVLDGIRERSPVSRGEYRSGVRLDQLPEHRQAPLSVEELSETPDRASWHPADPDPEPADVVADRDQVDRLLAAVPPRTARILRAYYLEGHTDAAIADDLGVSDSLVCKIRRAALATLRDHLEQPCTATSPATAPPSSTR